MSLKKNTKSPIAKRLRLVRSRKGLSQKKLGILAGFDEFSASPRINQYETGKHVPDYATAIRIAKALNIPVTYLYADEDELAEFILLFSSSDKKEKKQIMNILKDLGQK